MWIKCFHEEKKKQKIFMLSIIFQSTDLSKSTEKTRGRVLVSSRRFQWWKWKKKYSRIQDTTTNNQIKISPQYQICRQGLLGWLHTADTRELNKTRVGFFCEYFSHYVLLSWLRNGIPQLSTPTKKKTMSHCPPFLLREEGDQAELTGWDKNSLLKTAMK